MRRLIVALTVLALILTACVVHADNSEDFFLEKLWDTHTGFDAPPAGTLEHAAVEAGVDLDTYDFNLQMPQGITLQQNFQREAIEDETLPLARAIQETTSSEFHWHPSSTTSMSFTRSRTKVRDLLENELDTVEKQSYGLKQMFGSGPSASKLGFTRQQTEKMVSGEKKTDQIISEYFLQSGLAEGWDLSMKFIDTEKKLREYQNQDFTSKLVFPLSGGQGHAAFDATETTKGGRDYEGQVVDLNAPFAVDGGQALITHHREFADTGKTRLNRKTEVTAPLDFLGHEGQFKHLVTANVTDRGKETERRLTQIHAPLDLWGTAGSLEYTIDKQMKNSQWDKRRKWVLNAPFRLQGRSFGHEQTFIRRNDDGQETETLISEIQIPVESGLATVKRHVDRRSATEDTSAWKREQLLVRTPEFRVGDMLSLSAVQTRTEMDGTDTKKTTTFDLGIRPLERLTVNAEWHLEDHAGAKAERHRRVDTAYNMTEDTQLTYHFKQDDDPDDATTVQRHLLLKHKKRDLSLQAGYVSFGVPGDPVRPAGRVDIGLGRLEDVRLDASYKEYDPKKVRSFKEDPYVNLVLGHRPSKSTEVRLKYQDQKGRVAPERGVDFSFEALGGTWRLGVITNPIRSGEKHVTEADVYDVTMKRTVFNSLNLEASVLYYDYAEGAYDENVRQHYRFTLDGGDVDRGGNLAFSYASDELIRDPEKCTISSPLSILDLRYHRRWGDNGELGLVVTRETSGAGELEDGYVSGRLEYSVSF
ncbi:MAG: hypothetical protein R6V19_11925 [Armatimonadota bacterium]